MSECHPMCPHGRELNEASVKVYPGTMRALKLKI